MDSLDSILIRPGEHVCIMGMTGGGKSVIADYLMGDLDRMVVVDPKNEWRRPGFRRRMALEPWWSEFRVVWAPKRSQDLQLASLIRRAWKRRNLTIYIDELQSLVDFFPASTQVLNDVIRTGRSRKVSVWVAMQRPAWVPRWYLSESRHKFLFTLLDEEDRKRASQVMGPRAKLPLEIHDFLYHAPGLTAPALLHYNMRQHTIEAVPSAPSPVRGSEAGQPAERTG